MLTFEPHTPDNVIVGHASGKLTHEDYEDFRNHVEEMIGEHGTVRLMLELEDFHGWEYRAAWDELVMGFQHLGKFDRCVVLGEQRWEEWMVKLAKPLFRVEYFDRGQREAAWRWLMQSVEHGSQAPFMETISGLVRQHPVMSLLVGGAVVALLMNQVSTHVPTRSKKIIHSQRWS